MSSPNTEPLESPRLQSNTGRVGQKHIQKCWMGTPIWKQLDGVPKRTPGVSPVTLLKVSQHNSSFPGRSTRRLLSSRPHKPRTQSSPACLLLPLSRRLGIYFLPEGTDKSYAVGRVPCKTHVLNVSPLCPYHCPSLYLASSGHPTNVKVADCAVIRGDHLQSITTIRQEKKVRLTPCGECHHRLTRMTEY